MEIDKLKGKMAVVMGAAVGVGKAIALKYAQYGARVVLADADETAGKAVENEIRASGGEGVFMKTDMSDQGDVKNLFEKATKTYGPVDILVNSQNTPIGRKRFLDLDEPDWVELMEKDALPAIYAMWETLPSMRERKSGSIINVTSFLATKPDIGTAFYAYFKAGMNMMTKGLSVEYAPFGVRLNALAIGLTSEDVPGEGGEEFIHDLMGPDSLIRAGDPREIAEAAAWLASDEASYVAGAVIPVDGGVISTMRNYETGETISSN